VFSESLVDHSAIEADRKLARCNVDIIDVANMSPL
jgi:hypothetical protein